MITAPSSAGGRTSPKSSPVAVNTTIEPVRWLSVAEAVRTRGICRSMLYELIRAGDVKSSVLRKPGNSRGKRLINAESLDAYIEAHADQVEE